MKYSEESIQSILWQFYAEPEYVSSFNSKFFGWEMDFFALSTENGVGTEFEIKISRQDYKRDYKKLKHKFFRHGYTNEKVSLKRNRIIQLRKKYYPNRFCFVAPEGIIPKNDIPKYAGLIEIRSIGNRTFLKEVKKPPIIHQEDLRDKKLLLNFTKHLSSRKTSKRRNGTRA